MAILYEQIKNLYDASLYDDVKSLGSMVLTLSEHNPELLSVSHKYHILVFYGDALYQAGEYHKAEMIYKRAMQVKKVMAKGSKGKTPPSDLSWEIDVKYKLYLCYNKLKQSNNAIAVLESVSAKLRGSKINMALAKLYHKAGMDRSAITSYKEVLKECPMSLEAAKGLMALAAKGVEVASLVLHGLPNTTHTEWLQELIKAHAFVSSREYPNAIITFSALDNKPMLRDNVDLLVNLGEAQFMNGDYIQAQITLQRAHALDPLLLNKMDILAYLLYTNNHIKDLESLATKLMHITDTSPEPWVAMGYYCMATLKGARTVYFAQKAYTLDNRCIEALLLKGVALFGLKREVEAIQHYREALRLAPYRYEAHKGLVECYSSRHRAREAITVAVQAYKQLPPSARSLTLYATALAKEPVNFDKAKSYLEKAMKMDPNYLEAVYIMAEILGQQQQCDKAIELLQTQLRQHNTCRLYVLLGDFLSNTNDNQGALDQYHIALSLDPDNVAAKEGVERVEKQGEVGMDSTYDVEVEDMGESDQDLDGSDIESAWSDIDLS